eukprot:145570_1
MFSCNVFAVLSPTLLMAHFLTQISRRTFCSPRQSNNLNNVYNNKMPAYFASSIQPVILNYMLGYVLAGATRIGIFDCIPQDEDKSISIDNICKICETEKDITYRTLRYMSSMGFTEEIFVDDTHGYFKHTKESLDLCKDGAAYYTTLCVFDKMYVNSTSQFDEYLKGKKFEDLTPHNETFYDMLNHNADSRKWLWGTMKEMSQNAKEPALIEKEHFDFSDNCKYKKVIDIAGGMGDIIQDICKKYNHIEGVVFEQKKTIVDAKQYWLDQHNIDIDKEMPNMHFVEGDFFDENDIIKHCKNCDVIIMKYITHNWNDNDNEKILKNIRKSIEINNNNNIVLLICDSVLSEQLNQPNDLPYKWLDLWMQIVLNGKERRLSDFDHLFTKCGFERIDGYPKTFSSMNITAFKVVT